MKLPHKNVVPNVVERYVEGRFKGHTREEHVWLHFLPHTQSPHNPAPARSVN